MTAPENSYGQHQWITSLQERVSRAAAIALSVGILMTLSACGSPDRESGKIDHGATPNAISPNIQLEAPNPALDNNEDEVLAGLGRLEQDSHAKLFSGVMQFFGMPKSTREVGGEAESWHSGSLDLVHQAGMKPLIVFEPEGLDVAELATSKYDAATKAYYSYLKHKGATEKTVGTFVLMPELVAGGWRNANPGDFASIVNHQADLLHGIFPNAEATTMIDLQSAESDPLLPQLPNIEKSKLDSIGVQAFSNDKKVDFSHDNRGNLVADMSYMDPELIANISQKAANLPVWLNTGIPGSDHEIHYSMEERLAIARGIVSTVRQVQAHGVKVNFINLFAENKANSEGIDFSFDRQASKAILPFLAKSLKGANVDLYGFTTA